MGTRGGTGTVNEGLVFGYDTGAPLATRDINTRTYQGQPTQNIITDTGTMSGWSSYGSGNDGTFTTEFGTTGYRMTSRLSWNGVYKAFTLPSTGTYSFSAWFKYKGGSSSNNGATVYISSYGGPDTATAINKNLINQWQRIERVVNVTDVTVLFYLISYGGNSSVDRSSWEVTMPQIEKQSTRTPFVNGTRSSTQSLLDLKGSTDINVSNVSFDSNGLPTFDGTDDVLTFDMGTFPQSWASPFTIEMVIYVPTGATWYNQGSGTAIIGRGSYNGSWGMLRSSTNNNIQFWLRTGGNIFNPGCTITRDKYHHVVGTWDGNQTARIYLNGDLTTSETNSNVGTVVGNTGNINVGGNVAFGGDTGLYGQGTYPVVKIFSRQLSAQEIQQNYNAYKNRFNI